MHDVVKSKVVAKKWLDGMNAATITGPKWLLRTFDQFIIAITSLFAIFDFATTRQTPLYI